MPQKGIKMNTQSNTSKLAKMAMLVAVSIVLVALIHLPILPMVPFLEYDPADIPILLGTFAFGPVAGLCLTFVTAILQGVTVSAQSGAYGILMHIIATSALVLVAGLIYSRNKTKKNAILGLVFGTLAMVLIMIPANMLITTKFMGLTLEALMPFMPWIILFNFIKAGVNSIVTFLVYKRISPFLHR
jgi:riboflavin transporter FmnP